MNNAPTHQEVPGTLYHGGPAGRQIGALLLPPCITKAPSLSEYGAGGVHRKDRVYLTTSYAAAVMYAACWKKGVVYRCELIGSLEPDPDCDMPGLSWQCKSARVKRVIKPKRHERESALAALLSEDSK